MDDSISRAAAIRAIGNEPEVWTEYDDYALGRNNQWHYDVSVIKTVPAIQPKRGKWIYGEDEYGIDGYHCDKCGFFVPWDYAHQFINYIEDYNFCPNCGADMRGGEDAIH